MRVVEYCQAVWVELQYRVNRLSERANGLVRQPVHEIQVHALKAQFTSPRHRLSSERFGLDTIDGLLDFGVEVLDSHAATIESNIPQGLKVLAGQLARVDFDANLGVAGEIKLIVNQAAQSTDLVRIEVGRRPPSPM